MQSFKKPTNIIDDNVTLKSKLNNKYFYNKYDKTELSKNFEHFLINKFGDFPNDIHINNIIDYIKKTFNIDAHLLNIYGGNYIYKIHPKNSKKFLDLTNLNIKYIPKEIADDWLFGNLDHYYIIDADEFYDYYLIVFYYDYNYDTDDSIGMIYSMFIKKDDVKFNGVNESMEFKRPDNIVKENLYTYEKMVKEFFEEYVNKSTLKYKINSDKSVSCTGDGSIFINKNFINFYKNKYGYYPFDNIIPFKFKSVGVGTNMYIEKIPEMEFTDIDWNNLPDKVSGKFIIKINNIKKLPLHVNDLYISNSNIKSFEHIQNPETIKNLYLAECYELTSFKGLSDTEIKGIIKIYDCPIETFKDGPKQCLSLSLVNTNLSLEEIKKIPEYINIKGDESYGKGKIQVGTITQHKGSNNIELPNSKFKQFVNWQPDWYRNRHEILRKHFNESHEFKKPTNIIEDNTIAKYLNQIKKLDFLEIDPKNDGELFNKLDNVFKYIAIDDVPYYIEKYLIEFLSKYNYYYTVAGYWEISDSDDIILLYYDEYDVKYNDKDYQYFMKYIKNGKKEIDDIENINMNEAFSRPQNIVGKTIKSNITDWLNRIGITKNYTINSDNTITYMGKIEIKDNEKIPYKFKNVNSFIVSNSKLTEMPDTVPDICEKSFRWINGNLKTLKNSPKDVDINYDVRNNKLESIEGIPEIINWNCYLNFNELKNLGNHLKEVRGDLHLENNKLINLDDIPIVGYDLYIDNYFDDETIIKIKHKVKGNIIKV